MSKYHVGDTVLVRTGLIAGLAYDGGCYFGDEMKSYCGKEVTITRATTNSTRQFDRYKVSGNDWWWTNSMLEPMALPIALDISDIL